MVGVVTDSLDIDELQNADQFKVPSSPVTDTVTADCDVPSINDLDFCSPLFDSLPDFETLKDYWICYSPVEERALLEIEENVGKGGSGSLSVGGLKVEEVDVSGKGDLDCVINGECEAGGGVIDEIKVLDDVKSEEKITVDVSGSLSSIIEANLRKVSLDGTGDVSAAAENGMDVKVKVKVKAEEKFDEAESDDSSESESDSDNESSSSEDSSSEAMSSSEDDDVFVKRKAELAGQLEEGEIMDEDVEQMVAWSDDEEDVVKGPIRSKNEITDLPPVPPIEVTLNPSHQTFPVGVILSIVGKQVIVEGVEKHNPLNEGSILWITESREPLGLVDDIFGPVKNPYYSIRYNNEDDVPSAISVGTPISFVPEFVNHVLNDASLYKKGYDASNENDEELSEELEFSDDEKESEYRKMMKMSKRGSNEEGGGKKKKDKRKDRNQERIWNNQYPSPQTNSSYGDRLTGNSYQYPSAPETPRNQRNQFSEGGPPFPLSAGMTNPFQHIPQQNSFNGSSWPNAMPVQQQQQSMFFPNAFPTNGMPWLQQMQNNLVRNPYMPMSMPQGMPFPQQFGHNQILPGNLGFPGSQQFFMGGSSNPPFPGFFGQNNFNQGSGGQITATSTPNASITSIPSPKQNGVVQQQPSNIPSNTDDDSHQSFPDIPSGRGRNPNSQWRGRSGGRGGRFNRGRGNGRGRGHGHYQGN